MLRDRINELYDGTWGSPEGQHVTRERIHWLCRQATGAHVLDAGCSQGIASILLGREGKQVIGIDVQEASLADARARLADEEDPVRQRVEFRFGELSALPVGDHLFETVLLGEVLEHLIDIPTALAEVHRVLRPGGRVVLTTPYGISRSAEHKDPIYLQPLLRMLAPQFSMDDLQLIEGSSQSYLGLVASALNADCCSAPNNEVYRAFEIAERQLMHQDRIVENGRLEIRRLKDRLKATTAAAGKERDRILSEERAKCERLVEREVERGAGLERRAIEQGEVLVEAERAKLRELKVSEQAIRDRLTALERSCWMTRGRRPRSQFFRRRKVRSGQRATLRVLSVLKLEAGRMAGRARTLPGRTSGPKSRSWSGTGPRARCSS